MIDWTQPELEQDDVIESAVFGKTVEHFLASPIGKFLLNRANDSINDAVAELKRVSPWRRRKIQQLQNTIACWEGFRGRLIEAVQDGERAIQLLEDE